MRRTLPVALLFAVAATAVVYLYIGRTRLRFTNHLAAPVRLAIGERVDTVPRGLTVELDVPRGGTSVAEWELIRPMSADDRPMGEEIRGAAVLRGGGRLTDSAWVRQGDADFFAPLITNASKDLLRVTVNAGLQGALDCGCPSAPVRPASSSGTTGSMRTPPCVPVLGRGRKPLSVISVPRSCAGTAPSGSGSRRRTCG